MLLHTALKLQTVHSRVHTVELGGEDGIYKRGVPESSIQQGDVSNPLAPLDFPSKAEPPQ